jgi:hypothetical protein
VPLRLTRVTVSGPASADAAHPACTTTGVSLTPQTDPGVSVAANSTALVELPAAATMDLTASAGCQGASFSVPVTVEGRT